MKGLPDLGTVVGRDPPTFAAWFEPGAHIVVPDALALAARPDGSPDLQLELARGADAMAGPAAHGTLDLRLATACRLDAALTAARAADPAATVRPAAFAAGWLWLLEGEAVLPELAEPLALGTLGVGAQRLTRRLDAAGAMRLRRLLDEDVLLLRARAHLEFDAVAPRLPVKVRLRPRAARDAVAALGAEGGTVARDALAAAVRRDPAALGLELLGETGAAGSPEHEQLLETVAALLAGRVGTGAAGTPGGGPAIALAADLPDAQEEHDLRAPLRVRRAVVLDLPALADRPAAPLVAETVLPTLVTGMHAVEVMGNLPAERAGVLAIGATLTAPAQPPARPQAVVRSVELVPPGDRAVTTLALTPREPLAFRAVATAVLPTGRRVEGPARESTDDFVRIGPADLPVRFVTVTATPALLALARIEATLTATGPAGPMTVTGAAAPAVALALPLEAADATLAIAARPVAAEEPVLALAGLGAEDLHLDLSAFPQYGPHRIEVTCAFGAGAGACELELLADGAAAPSRLVLAPERPTATWAWFAASPFAGGYRYRRAGEAEWSAPRGPSEPLAVTAAEGVPA